MRLPVFISQGYGDDHKEAVNAKSHRKPRDHRAGCDTFVISEFDILPLFHESVSLVFLVRSASVLLN